MNENLVNEKQELQHIIDYMEATWDGFDKVQIKPFLELLWNDSLQLTKNFFEQHNLIDEYIQWNNERKDYSVWQKAGTSLTENQVKSAIEYDGIYQAASCLLIGPIKVYDIIRKDWDYEKTSSNLLNKIKESMPDATKLRPKGWKQLAKNYEDYDGQEEYNETENVFKGMNSEGVVSHAFHVRVALPYVMYDDKCQGRKPLYTLIGAILAHALSVNSHNNEQHIIEEINRIKEITKDSKYYTNIVNKFDIAEFTDNRLLKAFSILGSFSSKEITDEDHIEIVNQIWKEEELYKQLSPEEKEKKKLENGLAILEMLKNVKSETVNPPPIDDMKKSSEFNKMEEVKALLNMNEQVPIKKKKNKM